MVGMTYSPNTFIIRAIVWPNSLLSHWLVSVIPEWHIEIDNTSHTRRERISRRSLGIAYLFQNFTLRIYKILNGKSLVWHTLPAAYRFIAICAPPDEWPNNTTLSTEPRPNFSVVMLLHIHSRASCISSAPPGYWTWGTSWWLMTTVMTPCWAKNHPMFEYTLSVHSLSPEKNPPPWTYINTGLSVSSPWGTKTSSLFLSAGPYRSSLMTLTLDGGSG